MIRSAVLPEERWTVVTGGAGFIGSHLCDRLVERGEHVLAIDNLSTGDLAHLAHLQGHRRFRFVRQDLADPTKPLTPSNLRLACIYNLACPASPAYYQRHPIQTTLASSIGMWHVLERADREGARVLQASTSEVYGEPEVHPQVEDYWGHVNPFGIRSCYDEGKRCAEALCHSYAQERRLDIRVARLFNTFGPRLRAGDGRVVSNFIVQALRNEPLTIYGDGSQTRSFCFVDDTVEGLMRLMDSDVSTPVNIGNPQEDTVLQLAEQVLRLTASRSALKFLPRPADDPHRRRPDITKAWKELGWAPKTTLDQGLRATIAHLREVLHIDATLAADNFGAQTISASMAAGSSAAMPVVGKVVAGPAGADPAANDGYRAIRVP